MSDEEIKRIKAEHKRIRDIIHSGGVAVGTRIYLNGARPGQVGISTPVIDEKGQIWRYGHDRDGEYIEAVPRWEVTETCVRAIPPFAGFEVTEFDHDVIHRARMNADAPYDQDTCRRYPWAAAARIRYLEGIIEKAKELVKELG